MSFSLKLVRIFLVFGFLLCSSLPAFASGTCVRACRVGTAPATSLPDAPAADESACRALCIATSCPTGATCVPTFTADSGNVCACVCMGTGGSSPVMATTTRSCLPAALVDPACRPFCTTLCHDGRLDGPARVGMTLDPAPASASCVVLPPSAPPPAADVPASGASPPRTPPTDHADRAAVPLTLSQPIDGVRVVSDLGNYIAVVYRYAIGLAGTAAVIMIVYGGFLYLLGSAAGDVGTGKKIIQDALIGLLLVLGAYTILATVNPNTLNLRMPQLKTIGSVALLQTAPPPPCSVDTDCPQGRVCLSINGSHSCQTPLFQNTPGSEIHVRCERTAQCPPGQACTTGFCVATSPTAPCTRDAECGNGLTCIQGSQCCADATCATPTQATCAVTANCPTGSRCVSRGPRVCRPFERVCGPGTAPCPEGYTCSTARPGGPGLCRYVGTVLSTGFGSADLRCSCSCARPDGSGMRDVASRAACPSQSADLASCRASCDTTCADPVLATVPGLSRVNTAPTPCARPGVTSGAPLLDAPVCHVPADCPPTHFCLTGRDGSGICIERVP